MTPLPTVTGLFEAHLTVADLDRAVAFYRDVVGLTLALEVPERGAAFFWIAGSGEAMLGLWSLGSAPMALSLHIALKASLDDVLSACDALRSAAITPLSFFGAETTEPSVIAWMPAAAVYFRDPDGHQLEYLAMLDEPPRPDLGIVTWSEWTSAHTRSVRIESYIGARGELRALFEEAEDSAAQLDSYFHAGRVIVARAGDGIVGHLQLVDGARPDQSEIKNMAVEPSHRGLGIGRRLIDAAVEHSRAQNRTTITVSTAAADVGNLRFYQRAGFRFRAVERDAFTTASGYAADTVIDGIELRDRIWLDLEIRDGRRRAA
jgi:ribosomal protein S18 acetylase RimI-like enzyme